MKKLPVGIEKFEDFLTEDFCFIKYGRAFWEKECQVAVGDD